MKDIILRFLFDYGALSTVLIVAGLTLLIAGGGGWVISKFTGLEMFWSITIVFIIALIIFAVVVMASLTNFDFK